MGKLKHSNSQAKNKMEDKIKKTPLLIFIEVIRPGLVYLQVTLFIKSFLKSKYSKKDFSEGKHFSKKLYMIDCPCSLPVCLLVNAKFIIFKKNLLI